MKWRIILGLMVAASILFITYQALIAAPSRESGFSDARPLVAYGKDSNGVLRAILTDTSGVIEVTLAA